MRAVKNGQPSWPAGVSKASGRGDLPPSKGIHVGSFGGIEGVREVAMELYRGIATPVAKSLADALSRGQVDDIATASISHVSYVTQNPVEYYLDRQAVDLLRKFGDLNRLGAGKKVSDPRKKAALQTFFECEAQCKVTNERFTELLDRNICGQPELLPILYGAQRLIKKALGKAPAVRRLRPRFGPGATSCNGGDEVTIGHKLTSYPECTLDAVPYVAGLVDVSPSWASLLRACHPGAFYNVVTVTDDYGDERLIHARIAPKLVRGNRLAFVPKTALTYRGVCPEPSSNAVFQLALGAELADCLRDVGICKSLQEAVNKRYAQLASIDRSWATVDLHAASDTISFDLVRFLLPWDWFELLASFRSPETQVEGEWVELEKFSSMGNGYTFELETLIFWALARAVSDSRGYTASAVNAYGDDIIVDSRCVDTLHAVLSYCGFTVNQKKTHVHDGFNESCGGDYLFGHDVRPYLLEELPENALQWYAVANGLRKAGEKYSRFTGHMHPAFFRAWLCAIRQIPRSLRLYGPPGYGDQWIETRDTSRWRRRFDHGLCYCRGLLSVPLATP